MKRTIWVAFSAFLVLSLLLAGCGNRPTAEEIVAKVQETVDSTNDAHAIVTATLDASGKDISAKAEIWEKSPNKVRALVLDSSEPDLVRSVVVSDGQQAWFYSPAENKVMIGGAGEMEMPLPQEMLGELQGLIQQILDVSDAELVGEETVAGQRAYKLTLSPREDSGEVVPLLGGGTAVLWVDEERWIVLKATFEASALGQGSMEVESFELNPGLPDDLFQFEVPEGAEVVQVKPQQIEPLTLDEAKAQAGFPLLVPEVVPDGVTLIDVFKAGDSFVLRYDHSQQVSFTIIQGSELASPPPLGDSQEITVRGQSATVITDEAGGNTFLYWAENGVTITVAGHIGLDEALKVAESLK
jgi:outer membrane lipoprotein-sorting protein